MPPKAVLLIDNCSAHAPIETLQSKDGNIFAFLLPPNVTAAIQPMDQNPIRLTKLAYRKHLLSKLVAEEDVPISDILNGHTIREAILLLKQAWDEIPRNVLEQSWSKILEWDANHYDDDDNIPLTELVSQKSYFEKLMEETTQLLSTIAPNARLSLKEIEEWNEDISQEDAYDIEPESEDSGCDEPQDDTQPKIPYSTAIQSVNSLIKWCEQDPIFSTKHISNLLALRTDIVVAHTKVPKKQTTLTNFFQKND